MSTQHRKIGRPRPAQEPAQQEEESPHKNASEITPMSRHQQEPAQDHEREIAPYRPAGSLALPDLTVPLQESEPTPEEVIRALYGTSAPFITHRQVIFLESYLTCWNAARAARAAGYSKPAQTGYYLLQDKRIKAAIAYRLEQAAMSAQEVLAHIVDIARADIADLVNPTTLEPELIDKNTGSLKPGTNTIKKVSTTRDGKSIETYSRLQALELLGRAHGLFIDRHSHSGMIGVANITAEDLQAITAQAAADLATFESEILQEHEHTGPVHRLESPQE